MATSTRRLRTSPASPTATAERWHVRDHMPRQPQVSFVDLLLAPERARTLSLAEWDQIIPQARRAGLLARLANAIERTCGLGVVPAAPRAHLASGQILADKHRRDTIYELGRIAEVLGPTLSPIVLLKGAAYLLAELPPAAGRVFSDIDILVPQTSLASAEALLDLAGWRLGDIDPYDERYYRNWMHQLPPLVHIGRQSAIDVHHTIVPTTARIRLDANALLASAIPIVKDARFAILAPADMILHSATHLFNEGQFDRALRDLDDINLLLRHFGNDEFFWEKLVGRAGEIGLGRPLYYALRHAREFLGTPVPREIMIAAGKAGAPRAPVGLIMDSLFARALRSPHPDCRDALTGPALWLLYARAHYLRMPLHLLVPHLIRKAVRPVTQ